MGKDIHQEQFDKVMALEMAFTTLAVMLHMNQSIDADELLGRLHALAREFRRLPAGVQPGSIEDATPLAVELESLCAGIESSLDSLGETRHVRLTKALFRPPAAPQGDEDD